MELKKIVFIFFSILDEINREDNGAKVRATGDQKQDEMNNIALSIRIRIELKIREENIYSPLYCIKIQIHKIKERCEQEREEKNGEEKKKKKKKNVFLTYGARFLLKCLDSTNDILFCITHFSFIYIYFFITLPYTIYTQKFSLSSADFVLIPYYSRW